MWKPSRASLRPGFVALVIIAVVAILIIYWATIGKFIEDNEVVIEAISALAVAIFTFTLWTATKKLGELALEQSNAMERSISEAAKATEATAQIATATKENAMLMQSILHKQMRAYVSVDAGQATYQDGVLRFAAIPVMTNTGFTPARRLSFHAMAAVLDTNLRDDYIFDEFGAKNIADATLSPRQSFTFNAVVRERFADSEVKSIMPGDAKRLYVWGIITYDDVFGGSWETRFCFNYIFYRDEKDVVRVSSYIYRCHNSAT